ncbi:MAG: hypothetical protein ACXWUP_07755 [Allosphingosinicella sp.]
MSGGTLRRLAGSIGRLLQHVYPKSQSDWVRAMRHEVEQVEDDGAALRFALGCLWGGGRETAIERFSAAVQGAKTMRFLSFTGLRHPRNLGIACALAATCIGILHLIAAGAPAHYPVVNATAFLLGVVALGGLRGAPVPSRRFPGALLLVLGSCLLVTALIGASANGAARWIWIGPLSVQVSLVLLPAMIVAFARSPTPLGSVGIYVAAVALALQPDRAMAGVLALGMAVLAITRPGRPSISALIVALAAFGITLARPDTLTAVPFVDQVLFTAFDLHLLAGAAVLAGALLLLVPSIAGWRGDPAFGPASLVFGAVWLGCLAAAALGNYPTPVVGYGGSFILGYLLSLSCLPTREQPARRGAAAGAQDEADRLAGLRRSASPA